MQPTSPEPTPNYPSGVTPDILAWAKQTLNVEEVLRQVHEVESTGGTPLSVVINELEAEINEFKSRRV
jgi:hypothetical protein